MDMTMARFNSALPARCQNRSMSAILPHGANGIQGDGFAVAFGDGKIVFVVKRQPDDSGVEMSERHYTFHAGQKSGIIDVHETRSLRDGHKEHKTLFALRADDLPSVLQSLAPMLPELFALFRPLQIGWMKHRNIGVARGIEPVRHADVEAVTVKRKRKLCVDPERYRDNVFVPEYLEEIYDFPDGNFTLFHRNRNIGSRCGLSYPAFLDQAPGPDALRQ
jgi:hypothetical protein